MVSEKDRHIPRHLNHLVQAVKNKEMLSIAALKEGLETIDQAIENADSVEQAKALDTLRLQVLDLYETKKNDKAKHIWLAGLIALLSLILAISIVMFAYSNSSSKNTKTFLGNVPRMNSAKENLPKKSPLPSSNTNGSTYSQSQENSNFSSSASDDNSSSAESSSAPQSLTADQVSDWVVRTYLASQGETQFTAEDYIVSTEQGDDGLVYSQISENHSSAAMQAAGADPSSNPVVGFYRINAQGQLESSSDGGVTWTVVSDSY